jgi:hypothetical protein
MSMKENVPLYLLTCAILGMAVYLRSPMVCASIIPLWGINSAQIIMTRKTRDADIAEMQATLASHKALMSSLRTDITNVHERAKTILGENF